MKTFITACALFIICLSSFSAARDIYPVARTIKSPALIALGNANIGGVNNEASLEINPASLGMLEYTGVSFGGRSWIANMWMFSGNYFMAIPLENVAMGFGLGVDYLGFGKEGIDNYDVSGEYLGTLDLGNIMFNLGYGLQLPFGLSLGVGANIFNQKMGSSTAKKVNGAVLTFGMAYNIKMGKNTLDLGGNFKNTLAQGYSGVYILGMGFNTGFGLSIMASAEPNTEDSSLLMFNFGLKYLIDGSRIDLTPMLSLRQGMANADSSGINFGADIGIGPVKANLGFSYKYELTEFVLGGAVTYLIKDYRE